MEAVLIQGLQYNFPERPPVKNIRNFSKPRKQQKWSRHTEHEDNNWDWKSEVHLWPDEQVEWYWEEMDRIYDGEWIYIDGEPVYINGLMYFFLQWMYLENEYYPDYRDTALEYFRFMEIALRDPLCLGTILIKGRRLGASSMEASILLRNLLIHRNKRNGIISKTSDDAKDIFEFVTIAFQALPEFLKPQIEGNSMPKKVLSVKKKTTTVKIGQETSEDMEGLNNKLEWRATVLNSFDSGKLLRILIDESAKWTSVDIAAYWKVVQKCLKKGAKVIGKASFVSTVNKGDSGGDQFRSLWDDSDPDKRNRLGQTSSSLIRIFIPADMGYEGYIDEFGKSVRDTPTKEQTEYLKKNGCPDPYIGAKEYIQMQRDLNAHDPALLAEEIRTAPFTWQEVFDNNATESYFNNVPEMKEQELELRARLTEQGKNWMKEELGRRGWFKLNKSGKSEFHDDPKGLWYIDEFLEYGESNKFEYKGVNKRGVKKRIPLNTNWGGAGFDPFAHSANTAEKGSDACCVIRSKLNLLDPDNTDRPVAMFLGRMNNKKDLHDQIFAGLIYFGVMVLGERAPSDWVDYAEEEGLLGYVAITTRKTDNTPIHGLAPQGKEGIEAHLTALVEKCLTDVRKIPFIRLIQDRINFDPKARTVYDGAIADGYAIIMNQAPVKVKQQKREGHSLLPRGKISIR